MRRASAFILCMLLALPAAAGASVGAPLTHGPDPESVGAGADAQVSRLGKVAREADWCGPERATDDTESETDNGTFKYHAVYMLPADGADRFSTFATELQSDALAASALLETDYGRAIRFDMGTACGPQYLDITVVRMHQTVAQLQAAAHTGTGTFDAVSAALDAAGLETIQPSDSYGRAAE